MSLGLIQYIAVIAALGGFGVNANPRAPSATVVMKYAPADADFMIHVDLQAVVPSNYKALKALPGNQLLAQQPEARAGLEQAIREIDVGVNSVKQVTGMDPIEDLHSLSAWVKLPSAGNPDVLVVARGTFPADFIDKVGAVIGAAPTDVGGHKALADPGGEALLAIKGGELLFGTRPWVEKRLQDSWKPVRAAPGSAVARAGALLRGKPFLALVSAPSEMAAQRVTQELGSGDNAAADLFGGHEYAAVALTHDTVSWNVTARSKDGYDRAVMASEGLLDLFRASHFAARGLASFFFAALPSYSDKSPEIATILSHQGDILKVVTELTGDGKFVATVKKQAGKRTVSVTAKGKKLSDVLPIAGVLPAVGAGFVLFASMRDVGGPVEAAAEPLSDGGAAPMPDQPEPGLDVQKVYRGVKRARGM